MVTSNNSKQRAIAVGLLREATTQADKDDWGFYFEVLARRLANFDIAAIPMEIRRRLPGLRREAIRDRKKFWEKYDSIEGLMKCNEVPE